MITTWMFILTIALAAAFVVMMLLMVLTIIYYRRRLRDSHRTLARFIRENIMLHEKTDKIKHI